MLIKYREREKIKNIQIATVCESILLAPFRERYSEILGEALSSIETHTDFETLAINADR